MTRDQELFLADFKSTLEGYAPISDKTWQLLKAIVRFQQLEKGEILLNGGQLAKQFHFVCKGALRAFYTDANGNTYNKNIFLERYFAGSKVSLLTGTPSNFTIEALEESVLLNIDYKSYRSLIDENDDLKNFYIAYLERNWIFEKEQREISLVMENATTRYLKLLEKHPDIDKRIPQLHIASHLGITPTQLSRIRKEVKKNR
jgi:CRP-like cAMP-binding protein